MKNCIKCGAELDDSETVCTACGADQQDKGVLSDEIKAAPPAKLNVLAIIGFSVSVLAALWCVFIIIVLCSAQNIAGAIYGLVGIIVYIFAGILAFALSVGGLIWTLVAKHRGKWFAIVGMILQAVCAVSFIILSAVGGAAQ